MVNEVNPAKVPLPVGTLRGPLSSGEGLLCWAAAGGDPETVLGAPAAAGSKGSPLPAGGCRNHFRGLI